jgi:hypothetical protein
MSISLMMAEESRAHLAPRKIKIIAKPFVMLGHKPTETEAHLCCAQIQLSEIMARLARESSPVLKNENDNAINMIKYLA